MRKKKSRGKERAGVPLKEKIGNMDHFKYESHKGEIMKAEAKDGQSIADRELKRLKHGDVFRSNPQTVKQTNSNKRRYK